MKDQFKPDYDLKNLKVRKLGLRRNDFAAVVRLKPDVAEFFPDADSVNEALRFLIKISKENSRSTHRTQRTIRQLATDSVVRPPLESAHNAGGVRLKLVMVAKALAREKRDELDKLKAERDHLARPDFLWHYLLQSFAVMGRATGWEGLIGNQENYRRVRYEALERLSPTARAEQLELTCRAAKIRMPGRKARFILECFEQIKKLGGPEAAKGRLLMQEGRESKLQLLKTFSGIGDKNARNIMMSVYHEEFRDSIAIDARIKALSLAWGLSFRSYADHEAFYLSIAADAGLNGWELDRLMFNFKREFLARVS
jgi:hypothetical protein